MWSAFARDPHATFAQSAVGGFGFGDLAVIQPRIAGMHAPVFSLMLIPLYIHTFAHVLARKISRIGVAERDRSVSVLRKTAFKRSATDERLTYFASERDLEFNRLFQCQILNNCEIPRKRMSSHLMRN